MHERDSTRNLEIKKKKKKKKKLKQTNKGNSCPKELNKKDRVIEFYMCRLQNLRLKALSKPK